MISSRRSFLKVLGALGTAPLLKTLPDEPARKLAEVAVAKNTPVNRAKLGERGLEVFDAKGAPVAQFGGPLKRYRLEDLRVRDFAYIDVTTNPDWPYRRCECKFEVFFDEKLEAHRVIREAQRNGEPLEIVCSSKVIPKFVAFVIRGHVIEWKMFFTPHAPALATFRITGSEVELV